MYQRLLNEDISVKDRPPGLDHFNKLRFEYAYFAALVFLI